MEFERALCTHEPSSYLGFFMQLPPNGYGGMGTHFKEGDGYGFGYGYTDGDGHPFTNDGYCQDLAGDGIGWDIP